jgi:YVTN family beta-propeller protein
VIPTGRGAWSVAVAPSLRRAYVTNRAADTVTLVDLDRNAVAGTVTVAPDPHNVVVDEATRRVFVTLHGGTSAARGDAVAVLDALDGTLLATWPAGAFPAQLALDSSLGQLYVVNEAVNTLTVLGLQTGVMLAQVPMSGNPTDVAVSDTTGRVYVTDWITHQVIVLDGRTRAVVGQVPVGTMPLRVAVNPATERVYVADGTAPGAERGELWTVDGRALNATSRPLGILPMGIAVEPETENVLVTDARRGTLAVLDPSGQEVRWQGMLGAAPHTVVAVPALGRAYVVLSGPDSLAVLDWPPR